MSYRTRLLLGACSLVVLTGMAVTWLASLRPGQVVFIGTDGVWECPNASGELFGKERLHEVMRQTAGGSAAEVSQTIVDRLAAFRGSAKQVDDVTFIVIKVLARMSHHRDTEDTEKIVPTEEVNADESH